MSTTEKQVPDPPAKTNPFDLPPGDRTDPPLPEMTKGQVEAQVVLKGLNRSVEELKVVLDGAIKSLESDHFPELDAALVDVEKVKDKIEDTLKWTDRCQECRTAENEKVISKAEKLFRGILIEVNSVRTKYVEKKRVNANASLPAATATGGSGGRRNNNDDDDDGDYIGGGGDENADRYAIKLPKLSLPEFSGHEDNFDAFMQLFKASVLDNPHLSDMTRHQYLRSCLKGAAEASVKGFDLRGENLDQVIDILYLTYGNTRRTVDRIINSMIHHDVFVKGKDLATHLRSLYDTYRAGERSLRQLGFEPEKMGCFIVSLGRSKLPYSLKIEYESKLTEEEETRHVSGGIPYRHDPYNVENFFQWLSASCRAVENVRPNPPNSTHQFVKPNGKKNKNQSTNATTTAGKGSGNQQQKKKNGGSGAGIANAPKKGSSGQKQQQSQPKKTNNTQGKKTVQGQPWVTCPFCQGGHSPYRCGLIPGSLSVVDRFQKILGRGACVRCLRDDDANHPANCSLSCKLCGKGHNYLLHGADGTN